MTGNNVEMRTAEPRSGVFMASHGWSRGAAEPVVEWPPHRWEPRSGDIMDSILIKRGYNSGCTDIDHDIAAPRLPAAEPSAVAPRRPKTACRARGEQIFKSAYQSYTESGLSGFFPVGDSLKIIARDPNGDAKRGSTALGYTCWPTSLAPAHNDLPE